MADRAAVTPTFRRRVADLMLDRAFRSGLVADDSGRLNVIIGDWDDTVGDVFENLDSPAFSLPATLLMPAGNRIMAFTITAEPGLVALGDDAVAYDVNQPLETFIHSVIRNGSATLCAPGETPIAPPDSPHSDEPPKRQLRFEFERAA